MKGIYLWSQSLDNVSPNHLESEGELLASDDTATRQNFVSHLANITKHGTEYYHDERISIKYYNGEFALRLECDDRDVDTRISTIVCFGKFSLDPNFAPNLILAMEDFCTKISRPVKEEHFFACQHGLQEVKKKLILTWISMGGAILVALVLGLLLGRWDSRF